MSNSTEYIQIFNEDIDEIKEKILNLKITKKNKYKGSLEYYICHEKEISKEKCSKCKFNNSIETEQIKCFFCEKKILKKEKFKRDKINLFQKIFPFLNSYNIRFKCEEIGEIGVLNFFFYLDSYYKIEKIGFCCSDCYSLLDLDL